MKDIYKKIKKGDKLVCVSTNGNSTLTEGNIYTIKNKKILLKTYTVELLEVPFFFFDLQFFRLLQKDEKI